MRDTIYLWSFATEVTLKS